MKKILVFAGFAVLVASLSGCATGGRGGIFAPGAGERILETTAKGAITGAVIGGGVGILSEVFGGGDERGRGGVFVPGGYGGYDGGHGHGGGYNSRAEAVNARRYRAAQRDEERRRQEAIWRERYGRHR